MRRGEGGGLGGLVDGLVGGGSGGRGLGSGSGLGYGPRGMVWGKSVRVERWPLKLDKMIG
jgi:hypothetical protein